MYIDKDSFIVNDINLGKYVTRIEYQYPKIWGDDTGRNLAGSWSGTLIGIFPKFIVNFRKLTVNEVKILAPVLDSSSQTISYFDPVKNTTRTASTYTGDWGIVYNNAGGKTESFQISFICKEKRQWDYLKTEINIVKERTY